MIKIRSRNVAGLIALVGLAYAAGRIGPVTAGAETHDEREPVSDVDRYREATAPGPHHERLDALVGRWTGEFSVRMEPDAEPMSSPVTVTRTWVLGGRFLQEAVEAESDLGTFRGLGYIGYNNLDGQYEMVWMDTMSTALYTETGTFHADTKILHTRGNHRDPVSGRMTNNWAKLDISDPDRHTYVGWAVGADGVVFTEIEAVMERTAPTAPASTGSR